jgi:hypothetical protein
MPLGSVERFAVLSGAHPKRGEGPNGTFTATTTVDALQQLPPTRANLAKLEG